MDYKIPDTATPTFMDSDGLSLVDSLGTRMEQPKFVTNRTDKGRYAVKRQRWVSMDDVYAEDYNKMKDFVKSVGYFLYRACDEPARDKIEQAESSGLLD